MSAHSLTKSLIWLGATFLCLTLSGCGVILDLIALFGDDGYTVKRVADGDTIKVTDPSGNDLDVRFACIDAPEVPHTVKEKKSRKAVDKNQFAWGTKAQARVQELIEEGGDRVQLTVTDIDQYGRRVSEVRLPNGTFIQQVLTQEGLVQVYRPYLKNCPSAALVEAAEADAKRRRVGLWRDNKYVSAWEWRRKSK